MGPKAHLIPSPRHAPHVPWLPKTLKAVNLSARSTNNITFIAETVVTLELRLGFYIMSEKFDCNDDGNGGNVGEEGRRERTLGANIYGDQVIMM